LYAAAAIGEIAGPGTVGCPIGGEFPLFPLVGGALLPPDGGVSAGKIFPLGKTDLNGPNGSVAWTAIKKNAR
jgi:hypothetical protein